MDERLDFSQRAELEEEMDGPCSYEELRACLRHLAVVNRLTRAHRPILRWLDQVAAERRRGSRHSAKLKIVDVGCGYGDMLRRIECWARQRGAAVELVGIDVNENSVRAAREASTMGSTIQWVNGDVHCCAETAEADVFTLSGVTHHIAEPDIVRLIARMEQASSAGWFIADLHRMPMPYRVFDIAMRGPWWHRFIRPDGLRSIRRSFLAEDWQRMCSAAGLDAGAVAIREHRPARLCVERSKAA